MLQEEFPQGRLYQGQALTAGDFLVPLEDGQQWLLNQDQLTARERLLLAALTPASKSRPTAWQSYLEVYGPLPQKLKGLRFLFLSQQGSLKEDWLDLLASALPSFLASFPLDKGGYCLLLDQEGAQDIEEVLQDLLPALEYDFELTLQVFVGHSWTGQDPASWPFIYRQEKELFEQVSQPFNKSQIVGFSQVLLQQMSQGKSLPQDLMRKLAQTILDQDQMKETVQVMWKQSAVLTKAAQELFIHRNTLQHRLDKYGQETGFYLRKMDDLALAHMILLAYS